VSPRKITKSLRAARRKTAEARQEYFDSLSTQQKLQRAQGKKERAKLAKKLAKERKNG
jgi:hypothetical protein